MGRIARVASVICLGMLAVSIMMNVATAPRRQAEGELSQAFSNAGWSEPQYQRKIDAAITNLVGLNVSQEDTMHSLAVLIRMEKRDGGTPDDAIGELTFVANVAALEGTSTIDSAKKISRIMGEPAEQQAMDLAVISAKADAHPVK